MELTILKEKDIPLLSRKRITAEAKFSGSTPSKIDFTSEIAKASKSDIANIEIRHIYTKFGVQQAKVIAHIYQDASIMSKVVKKGKKQLEQEKKAAEEAKKAAEEGAPEKVENKEGSK